MAKFNLKNYLVSVIRRASYRSPVRGEALKRSNIGRNQYICVECPKGIVHPKKNIKVDHIIPVRPLAGWDSWDNFLQRMFCTKDFINYDINELQILCTEHHAVKTKAENIIRRNYRNEDKKRLASLQKVCQTKKKR